jgi:hypothetical protein
MTRNCCLLRLVEAIADALLQQERTSRYVTREVSLMLHILDNYPITKQLEASCTTANGGIPVMESGLTAVMGLSATSNDSEIGVQTGGNTPKPASTAAGPSDATMGIPGASVVGGGSLNSTPRSSRSNSNAPPPPADIVATGVSSAGGAPRHSRNNSNVSVEAQSGRWAEEANAKTRTGTLPLTDWPAFMARRECLQDLAHHSRRL